MKRERLRIHDVPPPPQARPPTRQKPKAAGSGADPSIKRASAPRKAEPPPAPAPAPVPSVEEQMEGVTSESILAELIGSRGLTSAFHRACAAKAARALARDHPRDASAWLELLPTATRVAERVVSANDAKQRLLELVMNAQAADAVEEQREVDVLRAENARLRAGLGAVAIDRAAEVAAGGTLARPSPIPEVERVITPTDIMPPCERSDGPPGPPLREAKPPTVIDVVPAPQPPPNIPTRAGDPTREGEWDRSENAAKWREYRRTHGDMDDYLL